MRLRAAAHLHNEAVLQRMRDLVPREQHVPVPMQLPAAGARNPLGMSVEIYSPNPKLSSVVRCCAVQSSAVQKGGHQK